MSVCRNMQYSAAQLQAAGADKLLRAAACIRYQSMHSMERDRLANKTGGHYRFFYCRMLSEPLQSNQYNSQTLKHVSPHNAAPLFAVGAGCGAGS